jgi:hypothetical protein
VLNSENRSSGWLGYLPQSKVLQTTPRPSLYCDSSSLLRMTYSGRRAFSPRPHVLCTVYKTLHQGWTNLREQLLLGHATVRILRLDLSLTSCCGEGRWAVGYWLQWIVSATVHSHSAFTPPPSDYQVPLNHDLCQPLLLGCELSCHTSHHLSPAHESIWRAAMPIE